MHAVIHVDAYFFCVVLSVCVLGWGVDRHVMQSSLTGPHRKAKIQDVQKIDCKRTNLRAMVR
jgi:NhaP-type Na+/H+ and K+/H+ antiporter